MPNRQIYGLILLGVIVGLGLIVIRPFLVSLAWAAILAFVTYPAHRRILGLFKKRPSLAATITTLLLIVVVVAPASLLLARLQNELADAYRELSTKVANQALVLPKAVTGIPILGPALDEAVNRILNDPEFRKQQVNEWLEPWIRGLADIVGKIGRSLGQLAITLVALFFFYRDGDRVLAQAHKGLKKIVGDQAENYFKAIGDTTRAVVSGLVVSALAQGFVAGVGYAMFGIGAPIILGVATAVTALVPFIGTVAVWGPIGIWLLISDKIPTGLALLAWGAFIVNPTDNILKPLLISSATDIPLIIMLFGVMGGLIAFGLVGLFLGPLILAVLLGIWREWLADARASDENAS
jgi:predicted PurR-regulated permease PerM